MTMDAMPPADTAEQPDAGGTLDAMAEALKIAAKAQGPVAQAADDGEDVTCSLGDDGSITVSAGGESMTVRADEILADDPDDDGDEAALAGVMDG